MTKDSFNRRAFLQLLSSGLIGASVDVDKLLWVPGEKIFYLPPAPVVRCAYNLLRGDVFTIDGVRANDGFEHFPQRSERWGLQRFVVLEDGGHVVTPDPPRRGMTARLQTIDVSALDMVTGDTTERDVFVYTARGWRANGERDFHLWRRI